MTDLLREALESFMGRNAALMVEMKVLITLLYLASGKMQVCGCDDLVPSLSSLSRAISTTMETLMQSVILLEIRKKQEEFRVIAGFLGVVSVTDGTHIRILALKDHETDFDRKSSHSINTQVLFDANYNILDVVAN